MAIDFPVYQPPDVSGAFQKGKDDAVRNAEAPLTLANMVDQEKLSRLTLAGAEKQQADQQKQAEILKGWDGTPEGLSKATSELTRAGLGTQAMDLMRFGQDYASGQYKQRVDQLDMQSRQHDIVATELDIATAQLDTLKAAGAEPAMLDEKAAKIVKDALPRLKQDHPELAQQIDQWAKNPGLYTYAGVKRFEQMSNQGQAWFKNQLEQARIGIQQAGQTTKAAAETEKERHDRALEDAAKKKAAGTAGMQLTPEDQSFVRETSAALADVGAALPAGMRTDKEKTAAIMGLRQLHPNDTPQQIALRVATGQTANAALKKEATTVAQREASAAAAIRALNEGGPGKSGEQVPALYDQLAEVGDKVDFTSATVLNSLESWTGENVARSDDLGEYMNVLADTRAEFASVLARGGQVTDASRIAAEHAFPNVMSKSEMHRRIERSKKVADAIQAGNRGVLQDILSGDELKALQQSDPDLAKGLRSGKATGSKSAAQPQTTAPPKAGATPAATPAGTPAPRSSGAPQGMSFASPAELQSAIAAGRVKKGDRVTVGGQSGTIQ